MHLEKGLINLKGIKFLLTPLYMIKEQFTFNRLTIFFYLLRVRSWEHLREVFDKQFITLIMTFPPMFVVVFELFNWIGPPSLLLFSMEKLVLWSPWFSPTTLLFCLHMISSNFMSLLCWFSIALRVLISSALASHLESSFSKSYNLVSSLDTLPILYSLKYSSTPCIAWIRRCPCNLAPFHNFSIKASHLGSFNQTFLNLNMCLRFLWFLGIFFKENSNKSMIRTMTKEMLEFDGVKPLNGAGRSHHSIKPTLDVFIILSLVTPCEWVTFKP